MSFMIVAIVGVGVMAAAGTAKLGMALAGRKKRIAEQKAAKEEMDKYKQEYENLDTSNLNRNVENQFQNLQNTYEDLTVNQQQAQFEAQQSQQSQANIMSRLSGAAGGSGIAALAQTMANQGQLQAQRASASIGMQESRIQQMQAQEGSRLQQLERRGEEYAERLRLQGAETARGLEWSKTGTLLGMSQQRLGAANQARAEAKAQQMSAIGDIGESGKMLASVAGKGLGGGGRSAKTTGMNNMSWSDQTTQGMANTQAGYSMRRDIGDYDNPELQSTGYKPEMGVILDRFGKPIV